MNKNILSLLVFVLIAAAVFIGKKIYMTPNIGDGDAPNFKAELIDGTPFELSDLRGKYVLLDFWGSWCGPCMKQVPDLKAIYGKYHGKQFKNATDFELVSVAIERNKKSGENAIKRLGLDWKYHIINETKSLRFFGGEYAEQFNIKEVPTTFLLDENGQIVGTNLSKTAMMEFLNRQLK